MRTNCTLLTLALCAFSSACAEGTSDTTTVDASTTFGMETGDGETGYLDETGGDGDGDTSTGDGDGEATTGDGDGDGDGLADQYEVEILLWTFDAPCADYFEYEYDVRMTDKYGTVKHVSSPAVESCPAAWFLDSPASFVYTRGDTIEIDLLRYQSTSGYYTIPFCWVTEDIQCGGIPNEVFAETYHEVHFFVNGENHYIQLRTTPID